MNDVKFKIVSSRVFDSTHFSCQNVVSRGRKSTLRRVKIKRRSIYRVMPTPCLDSTYSTPIACQTKANKEIRKQVKRAELVAAQHALHQFAQRTVPLGLGVASATFIGKRKLFDKQDVMLETSVEMSLETETSDGAIVVAVDVCVDAVETLEYLLDCGLEG
jgi:hypothetical protein